VFADGRLQRLHASATQARLLTPCRAPHAGKRGATSPCVCVHPPPAICRPQALCRAACSATCTAACSAQAVGHGRMLAHAEIGRAGAGCCTPAHARQGHPSRGTEHARRAGAGRAAGRPARPGAERGRRLRPAAAGAPAAAAAAASRRRRRPAGAGRGGRAGRTRRAHCDARAAVVARSRRGCARVAAGARCMVSRYVLSVRFGRSLPLAARGCACEQRRRRCRGARDGEGEQSGWARAREQVQARQRRARACASATSR